jgi:hypothetical protein
MIKINAVPSFTINCQNIDQSSVTQIQFKLKRLFHCGGFHIAIAEPSKVPSF